MPKPGADERKTIDDRFSPDRERAMARVQDEMKRIADQVGFAGVAQLGQIMSLDPGDMMK